MTGIAFLLLLEGGLVFSSSQEVGHKIQPEVFSDLMFFETTWGRGSPCLLYMDVRYCPHENGCFLQGFEGLSDALDNVRPPDSPPDVPGMSVTPKLPL